MNGLLLQIVFACGIIYGFITLFIAIKKNGKREWNQLILALSLIVVCAASFLIALE
ncbi:hypothetical protein [Bacillus sp. BHET2]|uniref:hypothetical protein n=1 Tax=Bacillus sp. BHET2 TaxID=2583818 RepID=UPI001486686A|nr:hypothetical protein [Bacillus sp. BHET2]